REGFIGSQRANRETFRLREGFTGPQQANREKFRLRAGFICSQRANRGNFRLRASDHLERTILWDYQNNTNKISLTIQNRVVKINNVDSIDGHCFDKNSILIDDRSVEKSMGS